MPRKNRFRIIIVLFFVGFAFLIAIQKSGGSDEFFKNYGENFQNNMQQISQKLNLPEISLPKTSVPVSLNQGQEETPTQEPKPTHESIFAKLTNKKLIKPQEAQVQGTKVIPLESASDAQYMRYKNELLCIHQNLLTSYSSKGDVLWEINVPIANPILQVADEYILIAEKGEKKFSLLKGKKIIYAIESENIIVNASVSSEGDVVLVTDKTYYRGSVVVYNKDGKQIFVWNSGSNDVLDAVISSASRRVAVALLNTTDGLFGSVQFFDLTKSEPYAVQEMNDSIVFDLEFLGETLNVVCDDKLVGMTNKGKIAWESSYKDEILSKYSMDKQGFKVFMYDTNVAGEIRVLDARGKEKTSIKSEQIPNFVDIYSGFIAYNNGRELIFGSLSAKQMKQFQSSKEIKQAKILDANSVLVIYNSSLEFITL